MEDTFWEKLQKKLTNCFVEHISPKIMTYEMDPAEVQTEEDKVYCVKEAVVIEK